jgi:hypothetical protein
MPRAYKAQSKEGVASARQSYDCFFGSAFARNHFMLSWTRLSLFVPRSFVVGRDLEDVLSHRLEAPSPRARSSLGTWLSRPSLAFACVTVGVNYGQ